MILPKRTKGRPSAAAQARYQAELAEFCRLIREINSGLDFKVSSRGRTGSVRGIRAGIEAAITCSARWTAAGRSVLRVVPKEPGEDFNDVIRRVS
jgi:hypothetical protein